MTSKRNRVSEGVFRETRKVIVWNERSEQEAKRIVKVVLSFDDLVIVCFFFSSRRRHTRCSRDWSSDVCSSDLRQLHHVPRILEDRQPLAVLVGFYRGQAFQHLVPFERDAAMPRMRAGKHRAPHRDRKSVV